MGNQSTRPRSQAESRTPISPWQSLAYRQSQIWYEIYLARNTEKTEKRIRERKSKGFTTEDTENTEKGLGVKKGEGKMFNYGSNYRRDYPEGLVVDNS